MERTEGVRPGAEGGSAGGRRLRADARLNEDRLLEAAARAFARDGAGAQLKAIAQDAGVGIGTLYRRFPSRERLVEAAYRNETAKLCAAAPGLLDGTPADLALRAWAGDFVGFMAAKHAMADVLQSVLAADGDLRTRTRDLLTEVVAALLAAGARDGTLRADADPDDVLMALGGVTLIAGDAAGRPLADRLLDLLLDGLRHHAPAKRPPVV
ncbi:TetR/AcrR family transcriptional regulator [Streptomyces sp. NPDC090306]|uniref:TetR/AcrR family transcriptional regulator n=1 Tax=Streptomyces sp. NPDC090306 TaxID=3365961 RepID=UPI00381E167B